MPEIFKGGFTVSNNNGAKTTNQKPSVIVRNEHKTIVAALYAEKGKVLERLRAKVLTPEWLDITSQLITANVPHDVIGEILRCNDAVTIYKKHIALQKQNQYEPVLKSLQELVEFAQNEVNRFTYDGDAKEDNAMIERAKLAMENVQGRL